MSTSYPSSLDDFSNPSGSDTMDDALVLHSTQHANINDAVEAIEAELGVHPSGSHSTVAARFTEVESSVSNVTKTIRTPHGWAIPNEIKVASGDLDFINHLFIPVPPGQTVTLVGAYAVINSGTSVTVTLKKDGVNITGYTSLNVTTTAGAKGSGTTTFTNNQRLSLVVTAVAGTPKNLSFTVYLDTTV